MRLRHLAAIFRDIRSLEFDNLDRKCIASGDVFWRIGS